MKKIVTKFNKTGACEIDINLVKKQWNNQFTILQYDEKYTLIKYRKNSKGCVNLKVLISSEQAQELITELDLKCIEDSVFKKAKSYKKSDFILSEIKRLQDILDEKLVECNVIDKIISSFLNAIDL